LPGGCGEAAKIRYIAKLEKSGATIVGDEESVVGQALANDLIALMHKLIRMQCLVHWPEKSRFKIKICSFNPSMLYTPYFTLSCGYYSEISIGPTANRAGLTICIYFDKSCSDSHFNAKYKSN